MTNYLKRLFANNGLARGYLYVWIAVCGLCVERFLSWSKTPPANWFEVVAFLFAVGLIAGNTVRSYIDQHISRNKHEAPPNNLSPNVPPDGLQNGPRP